MIARFTSFDVPGDPAALKRPRVGRNRATGRPAVFDPDENIAGKGEIVRAWHDAGSIHFRRHAPVKVTVTCWFRRPNLHYGTGRNSTVLKEWAPVYVTRKPDLDNIEKIVGDALNGYAWDDDSQIAHWDVRKVYLDPVGGGPRLSIQIERLEAKRTA